MGQESNRNQIAIKIEAIIVMIPTPNPATVGQSTPELGSVGVVPEVPVPPVVPVVPEVLPDPAQPQVESEGQF